MDSATDRRKGRQYFYMNPLRIMLYTTPYGVMMAEFVNALPSAFLQPEREHAADE
jgi:hypothetical protein